MVSSLGIRDQQRGAPEEVVADVAWVLFERPATAPAVSSGSWGRIVREAVALGAGARIGSAAAGLFRAPLAGPLSQRPPEALVS